MKIQQKGLKEAAADLGCSIPLPGHGPSRASPASEDTPLQGDTVLTPHSSADPGLTSPPDLPRGLALVCKGSSLQG